MTAPEPRDIIDKLYDTRVCSPAQNYCYNHALFDEAAHEITRLRKELANTIENCANVAYKYEVEALALADRPQAPEVVASFESDADIAENIARDIRALTSPPSPDD